MKPLDSTTRSETDWMPSPMSMVIKMMAAVQAGQMSQQDADLMDQMEPDQWPKDLWMKMGVTPPEGYQPEAERTEPRPN